MVGWTRRGRLQIASTSEFSRRMHARTVSTRSLVPLTTCHVGMQHTAMSLARLHCTGTTRSSTRGRPLRSCLSLGCGTPSRTSTARSGVVCGACSRQRAADNVQQTMCSRQHAAGKVAACEANLGCGTFVRCTRRWPRLTASHPSGRCLVPHRTDALLRLFASAPAGRALAACGNVQRTPSHTLCTVLRTQPSGILSAFLHAAHCGRVLHVCVFALRRP